MSGSGNTYGSGSYASGGYGARAVASTPRVEGDALNLVLNPTFLPTQNEGPALNLILDPLPLPVADDGTGASATPRATAADIVSTVGRMLEALPYYYDGEELIARIQSSLGREHARLASYITALQAGLNPLLADDSLGLLARWEEALGLPVGPSASVAQRRAAVRSRFRGRDVSTGTKWRAAIAAAAAPAVVQIQPNTPQAGHVTINMPFDPSSYQGGTFIETAEAITPAHVPLHIRSAQGFIVGRSKVGIDAL